MKKNINTKKTNFFKRIFILFCRKIGFEIIDQSNLFISTQNKFATENLSSPGASSISIPLGKIKIKRKVSDLTIIIRSYTSTENKSKILLDQNKKRIFEFPKIEYTLRTINSVINSCNNALKIFNNLKINLIITDDHSSNDSLLKIKNTLNKANFETSIIKIRKDEFLGENFRISELTGAVALKQLEKLDRITGSLRAIYKRYREGIEAIPGLTAQPVNDPLGALATRWGLLFEDTDTCTRFSGLLRDKGLSPGLMYGGNPIYMQPKILNQVMHTPEANPWTSPAYKGETRSYHVGLCPKSEDIMNRVLMVASVNPLYTEHDVDGILSIIREAAGSL
mgnify:CR=1 FL=1